MQAKTDDATLLAELRRCASNVHRARSELAAAITRRDREVARLSAALPLRQLATAACLSVSGVRRAAQRMSMFSPWFAIDSAVTVVHDDAIRVRYLDGARWRVEICWPAIADVVVSDSDLDRQARTRGRVEMRNGRRPMLTRKLELDWSLGPAFSGNVLVMSFEMCQNSGAMYDASYRRDVLGEGDIQVLVVDRTDMWPPELKGFCSATGLKGSGVVGTLTGYANAAATTWVASQGRSLVRETDQLLGFASDQSGRYAQITNPLRQYASLLNQRVLLAELDGEPHSLTDDDLAVPPAPIVASVRNGYPIAAPARRAGGRDWHARLRRAITGRFDPSIGALLEMSRCTGILVWQDVALVLDAGPDWSEYRDDLVSWVRTHRPDIVHELLRDHAQRADVTIEFEIARPDKPIRTAAFACRALLNGYATHWCHTDVSISTFRPVKKSSKAAKHDAAWAAIEVLRGSSEVVDIAVEPEFPDGLLDVEAGAPTPFWHLADIAGQQNLAEPTFDIAERPYTDDSPQYACTATMGGLVASGRGCRAGAAKFDAANALVHLFRSESVQRPSAS